eukprot:356401-Chlamydomonas_euryale.AAC.5
MPVYRSTTVSPAQRSAPMRMRSVTLPARGGKKVERQRLAGADVGGGARRTTTGAERRGRAVDAAHVFRGQGVPGRKPGRGARLVGSQGGAAAVA